MSDRLRVALPIFAGYYLGRRRKVRMAAALAAAGLAGKASNGGPLAQGVKALGSAVELQQLTDSLRGELIEVAKTAALTAASRQIDSMSQRLQDRATSLGDMADQQEASGEEEEHDEEPRAEEERDEEAREEEGRDEEAREEEGRDEEAREEPRAEEAPEVPAQRKAKHERTRGRPFRRVSQARR